MVENAIFTLKTQIMATLTLVIVPAKRLSDGTHKIRIRVAHNSETRFITTDIVVRENEFKNGKIDTVQTRIFSIQNYNSYTTFISSDTWNWTTLIRSRARN